MKINEEVKKCVAFLQYKSTDNSFFYAGTCFFISKDSQDNRYKYAVTAKHVINEVKKLGLEQIFVKINLKGQSTDSVTTNIEDWIFDDDDNIDIAIYPFELKGNYDHLYYPVSAFLSDEIIASNDIDCGEEVFITGLFKYHYGKNKNLPIVRMGNISMMPNEKVQVGEYLMDAYLIESRSMGGLSGSPVFVNLGLVRVLNGELKFQRKESVPNLLGLICGHFDSTRGEVDFIEIDSNSNDGRKLNVGIAIATPVTKLNELLESGKIKKLEQDLNKF